VRMRALLLREQKPVEEGPLSFSELPIPEPEAGQILLRVLACGVCHTDLHIAEGDLPLRKSPVVLGHQVVGEVVEVGPGVFRFEKGQRVGLFWLAWACGECSFCRRGLENLCPKAQFTGYTVDGGFAEYTRAFADFAFPLPEDLPPEEEAPLLCAGIVGFRALKLSGAKKGGNPGALRVRRLRPPCDPSRAVFGNSRIRFHPFLCPPKPSEGIGSRMGGKPKR